MEVYGIFDKEAGRFVYIGATKLNAQARFVKHIEESLRNSPKMAIARLIKEKGKDNFEPRVLKTVETVEDLLLMEIAFIAKYDTFNNGCNETIGGDGWRGRRHTADSIAKIIENGKWYRHSEETKQKIGEAGKGRVFSEETRRKISESLTGRKKWTDKQHPQFGTHRSDETKRKLSEAGKGRIATDEARANMSAAGKGKPKSEAHRKALSEAKKGKTFTEEHRQKLRDAQKRRFDKLKK